MYHVPLSTTSEAGATILIHFQAYCSAIVIVLSHYLPRQMEIDDLDYSDIEAVKAAFQALVRERDAIRARADEYKARSVDLDKQIAAAKADADAAKARADAEKARADAEKALNASTSLHVHLYNLYSYSFQSVPFIKLDKEITTDPTLTSIAYPNCPGKLLHWQDFPEIHKQQFDNLSNSFGNNLVLPCTAATCDDQTGMSCQRNGNEAESTYFCSHTIERPTEKIANAWIRLESKGKERIIFGTNSSHVKRLIDLETECHSQGAFDKHATDNDYAVLNNMVDLPEDLVVVSALRARGPSRTATSKRPAPSPPNASGACPSKGQSPNDEIKPDDTCVRIVEEPLKDKPKHKNLLVIEHKPANAYTPAFLKNALEDIVKSDGAIFLETRDFEITGGTKKKQGPPTGVTMVARALVPLYNHMVDLGLSYGYLSTGECIILLHIDYEEPSKLYFHLCIHQRDVSGIPLRLKENARMVQDHEISSVLETGIRNTPYAIVMTMIQLAVNQRNLSLQEIANVQKCLSRCSGPRKSPAADPSPGPGKEDGNGGGSDLPLGKEYPLLPALNAASSSEPHEDPSKKHVAQKQTFMNPGPHRPPQPEYCSQKCLLGVVNGDYIDESCPNSHLHRQYSASSDGKHPLTLAQLVDIIQTQLDTNLDSDCEVQRHKSGLFGTLVKLTAYPYGYTFVGKGTMDVALPFNRHELQVYSRLRPLQGVVVPVCLGHVSLHQTLNVEFFAIRQMLLLSYAGEPVWEMEDDVDDIESQLRELGVLHYEISEENVTYNAKSDCTMLIDFNQSWIYDLPSETETESVGPSEGIYKKDPVLASSTDNQTSRHASIVDVSTRGLYHAWALLQVEWLSRAWNDTAIGAEGWAIAPFTMVTE
ncbi:hypothetical protein HOO65_020029 [Ceratocystis lukuohia]|uniref:Uncharacterized protein n=1 Tax=Ceratocystis lukuohia TaxID=2019550 RepID=A0ABR4MMG8_9PEZI